MMGNIYINFQEPELNIDCLFYFVTGSKAVFLSSIGGYANTDDPTLSNSNVFLFYIIPVTNAGELQLLYLVLMLL